MVIIAKQILHNGCNSEIILNRFYTFQLMHPIWDQLGYIFSFRYGYISIRQQNVNITFLNKTDTPKIFQPSKIGCPSVRDRKNFSHFISR